VVLQNYIWLTKGHLKMIVNVLAVFQRSQRGAGRKQMSISAKTNLQISILHQQMKCLESLSETFLLTKGTYIIIALLLRPEVGQLKKLRIWTNILAGKLQLGLQFSEHSRGEHKERNF